jgi:hypothetical protein
MNGAPSTKLRFILMEWTRQDDGRHRRKELGRGTMSPAQESRSRSGARKEQRSSLLIALHFPPAPRQCHLPFSPPHPPQPY